ncbi:MAG: ATP-binding protein [Oscillospiraceae bacterium]|nr:ATP-binding protein [Oscillospiraceae bacterium]
MIAEFLRKARSVRQPYVQVLFVLLAFGLMVFSSYTYMRGIEGRNLTRNAINALANAQTNIETSMQEPETALGIISEDIRVMIINGAGLDEVAKYIDDMTEFMNASDRFMTHFTGAYGFFDVFGEAFHAGIDWTPPDDYIPQERPWFEAAVGAGGGVGVTDPYMDVALHVTSITYAREIYDNDGIRLGIVCLDIKLDRIIGYAVNSQITESSYGILATGGLELIAHPIPVYIGMSVYNLNDGAQIADDMLNGRGILTEREVTSHNGEKSAMFYKRLSNGWYLGLIVPYDSYYQNTEGMAWVLTAIGLVLAAALSAVLLSIASARSKSDEENRQKSNFMATISHEIRTPLNSILGIAEIQLMDDTLATGVSESFHGIYNSGYTLLRIINDILDLSKIEAGKMEIRPADYEVASLINDTAQLNVMQKGSKPVEFKLDIKDYIPSVLYGDELRIKQIMNNLLSNAFKYTEKGEVTLTMDVRMGEHSNITLIIRVSDTGPGMTDLQVSQLYDSYSRFYTESTRTIQGTGLGMSITQNLVRMMEGEIFVESKLGKGSTFTVRIPQKSVGAGPLGKELTENLQQFRVGRSSQAKNAHIVREPMPYGSVLIVDDVETNLYVAKGLMMPYGLSIDTALSGFEAIDKIKAGYVYDIVFMDHMMPKMDGIETTKRMRALGYAQPIVALTANAVTGQAEMFLASGFDDFVSKPIDIRHLNLTLNKLIRDKQLPETIEEARRKKAEETMPDKGPHSTVDTELARIFARDAQKAADVLEAVYEKNGDYSEEDIQAYTINVHAMKSALASIGQPELSASALSLENAVRRKNTAVIAYETPSFLSKLRAVAEQVMPKEENEAAEEDTGYLRERLLVIQEACSAYDKKAAKNALADLKQKTWSRETNDLLNGISEHLLHSDFDEAADTAEQAARKLSVDQ